MRERRFKISVYAAATMPMARLAEYMGDIATLLGESKYVHFSHLEDGSTIIRLVEEDEALSKIDERLARTRQGEGPSDANEAIKRINRKLREDNGTGSLTEITGAEIIGFPGCEAAEDSFGAFNQQGSLDGVVIVVGGKGDPVPVHIQCLENADLVHNCYAARDVAKTLARYIFGPELRVSGTGRWLRDAEGNWNLDRFTIASFEVLNEEPLTSVVASLRAVKGSEWETLEDPWAELAQIRKGPDEDRE